MSNDKTKPYLFRILTMLLAVACVVLAYQTMQIRAKFETVAERYENLKLEFDEVQHYEANITAVDAETGEKVPIRVDRKRFRGGMARSIECVRMGNYHTNMRWIGTGPFEIVVWSEGYKEKPVFIGSNYFDKVTVKLSRKEGYEGKHVKEIVVLGEGVAALRNTLARHNINFTMVTLPKNAPLRDMAVADLAQLIKRNIEVKTEYRVSWEIPLEGVERANHLTVVSVAETTGRRNDDEWIKELNLLNGLALVVDLYEASVMLDENYIRIGSSGYSWRGGGHEVPLPLKEFILSPKEKSETSE